MKLLVVEDSPRETMSLQGSLQREWNRSMEDLQDNALKSFTFYEKVMKGGNAIADILQTVLDAGDSSDKRIKGISETLNSPRSLKAPHNMQEQNLNSDGSKKDPPSTDPSFLPNCPLVLVKSASTVNRVSSLGQIQTSPLPGRGPRTAKSKLYNSQTRGIETDRSQTRRCKTELTSSAD